TDGDGYGVAGTTRSQCDQPSLHASNDDDCNDASAAVSPGDAEVCDAADVDEDCDGRADDADTDMPTTSKTGWAVDADADGWGSGAVAVYSCATPAGYAVTGDCNDGDDVIHPDAADACTDEVDADCDGVTVCGSVSASAAFTGSTSSASYGRSVAAVWDVDGDGIDDVAAGAPSMSSSTGEVVLLDVGAGSGTIGTRRLVRVAGDGTSHYLGNPMTSVPDVDGDGKDDLVVTSYTAGGTSTVDGKVYVLASASTTSGASGTASSLARTIVYGSYYGASLGYDNVAGLDWDGDGDGEVVAFGSGTYSSYGSPYRAYVLDLESTGTHTEEDDTLFTVEDDSGDYLRANVCTSDANGDGLDDLFVSTLSSSYTWTLRLFVSTGTSGVEDYTAADATWSGTRGGYADTDFFGGSCGTGDFDGDGDADLAVGAPHHDASSTVASSGRVYVYTDATRSGTSATATIAHTTRYGYLGNRLTVLRDIDGDGRDELAVGYRNYESAPGKVGIYGGGVSGTLGLSDAQYTISGRSTDDYFADEALLAQDIDGDGLDDLLVGAQGDDGGGSNVGAVFVYFGETLFEP
ncbi:MAG: putative metal-binding motif-containing protein, partial [Myxococcota bacterium]